MLGWLRASSDPRARLGRRGERLAERFLRRQGYRRLARNVRERGGELDLVMQHEETVVFVEVKTRSNEDFVAAETAVNSVKQRHVTQAARTFLRRYRLEARPYRFDVVVVVLAQPRHPEFRHYLNAFRPARRR